MSEEMKTKQRFSEDRIEQLLQASNDLSEGEEITYEDARDLSLYFRDELDRVTIHYQSVIGDIALAAMQGSLPAKNAQAIAPLCKKCQGKGYYHYDSNQAKPCEQCCDHSGGWWELTEHHAGYIAGADNGCCRSGCGQLRRELAEYDVQNLTRKEGCHE